MRAGVLEWPIEVLRLSTSRNEFGEQQDRYEHFYNTRAEVKAVSGGRTDDNHEIFYEHRKMFTVRSYVPVQDFDRIMFKGQMYQIENIDEDRHLNCKFITASLVNV